MLVIAVDTMGGDHAPSSVIEGVKKAQKENPDVFFLLYGDKNKVAPYLEKYRLDDTMYKFYHTEDVVSSDAKPSVAVRTGRKSSLWKAIYAVRSGEAQAVVSAGNTGAFMAMSKICLGMIANIDRPALTAIVPSSKGFKVCLDLGANAECHASNLVDFALMGSILYRISFDKENPTVGLLNIGSEEVKGKDEVREAANRLREIPNKVNYKGFVEGNDYGLGSVDVYVSDGFSGNVALKTMEGTMKMASFLVKQAIKKSLLSKIGILLMIPSFLGLKKKIDPRLYNGAMLLGLNGLCVKAHGNSDAFSLLCAINRTVKLVKNNLCETIRSEIETVVFGEEIDINEQKEIKED
ncbi:MAG: phosphate acyltransferase PlsX [Alphaproteobacteria bacterium]|nr:phosphate acyltransferase PlsX [Alphaproteobacteria bacterium]